MWKHFKTVLRRQGWYKAILWVLEETVRIVTGAPRRKTSEIGPNLFLGGQYRKRGWRRLTRRGVRSVVNMRDEYRDDEMGIAPGPGHYLYLPTVDQ